MRFASLGSGSRGNGTLVEEGSTRLLIDCGFSARETERRLARLGRAPGDLSALLVTHEHGDHLRGVGVLARRYRLPVWMTPGTRAACAGEEIPRLELFNAHEPFALGAIEVTPYPVPHDAREPAQFRFGNGAASLGLLTDSGWITPHIVATLARCDALLLECNHDPELLASGPYPRFLKERVGGRLGHLSNQQAVELLSGVDRGRLQHVVAAHLSEKNNTPAHVRSGLAGVLGCRPEEIDVACQEQGFGWREVR